MYWRMTEAPHKPRCPIEGCDRPIWCKGYCSLHFKRGQRSGDPTQALGRGNPGRPRGIRKLEGRHVTEGGYVRIRIFKEDGRTEWILEHRFIMSRKLGRDLYEDESVHHKNGNKEDNAEDNLELWLKPQPTGIKVEDAVKWAHEILGRYEQRAA